MRPIVHFDVNGSLEAARLISEVFQDRVKEIADCVKGLHPP